MSAAHAALKEGSYFLCFCDWRQLSIVKHALQCADFTYRGLVVWHKPNSRPQRNAFRQETEFVVWGLKGARPKTRDYKCLRGLYCYPSVSEKLHLTEKPIGLMHDLLAIVPEGGSVCDPFMGSGTTGIAAVNSDLDFFGSEIGKESFELASLRILKQSEIREKSHAKVDQSVN